MALVADLQHSLTYFLNPRFKAVLLISFDRQKYEPTFEISFFLDSVSIEGTIKVLVVITGLYLRMRIDIWNYDIVNCNLLE